MGARQVNLLEMVFAGPGDSCCVVTSDERAQACIIDLDSVGAVEEVLRQRREHRDRPLMLTGVRRPPEALVAGDLFVAKPIRVDALVEAVTALRTRVRGAQTMHPADLPPRHRESGPDLGDMAATVVLPVITLHPVKPVTPATSTTPVTPATSPIPLHPERRVSGAPATSFGSSPDTSSRSSSSSASARSSSPSDDPLPGAALSESAGRSGGSAVSWAPGVPRVVRPRVIRVGSAWQATGEVLPQVETVTGPDGVRVERISTYEPVRYLQGLVVRARREGLRRDRAVHLEGPWPTITLLPSCGRAVVAGGAEALRPFSPQYDLPSHGRVTFTPAPLFSPNHPDAVDLEGLIWELALGASGGRVPEGTRAESLCSLQDWPNFTRLTPTPGAMSIAALWTRQSITLEETARTLQVPLKEVCSFYSAAHAVGLIAAATDAAPATPAARSVTPSPRRGLLRRMFQKLYVA